MNIKHQGVVRAPMPTLIRGLAPFLALGTNGASLSASLSDAGVWRGGKNRSAGMDSVAGMDPPPTISRIPDSPNLSPPPPSWSVQVPNWTFKREPPSLRYPLIG